MIEIAAKSVRKPLSTVFRHHISTKHNKTSPNMKWYTVPVCSLVQWGKSLTSAEVPHGPDRGTKLFAYKLSLAMRCSLQLKLWSLELHLAVGWSAMSCHVGSLIWVLAHLSCVVISFSCFDLKLLLRGWVSLRFYHQPTHSSSPCPLVLFAHALG